ncbi:MAG: class I SAM-dependent methyltransferase [Anaerolineae bacterium]|jgi:SAM-dependent methyltransferase
MHHSEQDSESAADRVQDFYERYPYPRPVDSLDAYRRRWQDEARRRADFHLFWPDRAYQQDRSILIAGCGTSQAAKHALRWPTAQVTGIDFSATSVRCTEELKRQYGLDNLQVYQLPVERVGELGMAFDQIVCTGVLHHLANPDTGLAALRAVLKLDGAIHLMVYAPYGRTGIYMLQDYCRRLGVRPSGQELLDLAGTLQALPRNHPLDHLLRETPDFRREGALADALLHPQDRAYSVPQLFDLIRGGGLVFGRWLRQAPYLAHCGSVAATPHASRLARLPAEEQYAAVELFRGTMVRHSAVVYRKDRPGGSSPIRFEGKDWKSYVPLRLPATISVEERLPPGAAAVLINQSHTYTDLYLPIDRQEKRLFDSIDGKQTIAELVHKAWSNERRWGRARSFFQRLWWYDQVVFDASRQPGQELEA